VKATGQHEATALAALDPGALIDDAAAFLRVPSTTGQERVALEALAGLAAANGRPSCTGTTSPPCGRIPTIPARRRRARNYGDSA
jgi:hypothetical protein